LNLPARLQRLALAKQERKYVQNYADAKTVVIEEIIVRALVDRKRMKLARQLLCRRLLPDRFILAHHRPRIHLVLRIPMKRLVGMCSGNRSEYEFFRLVMSIDDFRRDETGQYDAEEIVTHQ
jgi:hypothetical protein